MQPETAAEGRSGEDALFQNPETLNAMIKLYGATQVK